MTLCRIDFIETFTPIYLEIGDMPCRHFKNISKCIANKYNKGCIKTKKFDTASLCYLYILCLFLL